jgi:hypothetical protein
MNNLINSLTGKYIVNILMLIVFTGLAVTGIFFMEGGGRQEQSVENGIGKSPAGVERSARTEHHGHGENRMNAGLPGERSNKGEGNDGIHQTLGIFWLILMFLHSWQNWNWYRRFFTLKQIMRNKLLTITTFLFVLMVLSSIGLEIEVIPGSFFNIKEIHGFIGQVLTGLMFLHVIQRFKWYLTVTRKLMPGKTGPVSAF